MKTLLVIVISLLLSSLVYAEPMGKLEVKVEKKTESICPKTLINNNCLGCHVLKTVDGKITFGLREINSDAHLDYPEGTKIINYGTPAAYGYYQLGEVDYIASVHLMKFFTYLKKHNIKKAQIEILSGGGNLLIGWRIKSMLDEWNADGNIVETKVRGLAASAAFLIFISGTKGHRIANATSELMMHELRTWQGGFLFIKEVTPASAEEEAKVYKHLQDTIAEYIASRGKIPKAELCDMMKFREFWMNGRQAKEHGFVDVLIGE